MFRSVFKLVPSFHKRFIHKQIFSMEYVYFRHADLADQFQISFKYESREYGINREFNFDRRIQESLRDCLNRINNNIDRAFEKKNKKKKGVEKPKVDVKIYRSGTEVPGDLTLEEVLKNDSDLTLKVLEKEYTIIKNAPWISQIALPSTMLANFPVYANKFEILFGTIDQCIFTWYKGKNNSSTNDSGDITWTETSKGFVYYPTNDEIGYKVKVICEPRNEAHTGPGAEVISNNFVEAGPGSCPFETRHLFTQDKLSGNKFRICTYNLLADMYCDSDFTRTELYPYCPPYALHIDYRKQLFIKELMGYNFDIACLQEVDGKIFDTDLKPVFASLGYDGYYKKKGATVSEGLAVFFNRNRFECLDRHGIILGDEVKTLAIFNELWKKIERNEPLVKRLCERTTAVQALIFKSLDEENELLVVGNTHLYFHPDADHIRLLQAGFAITWINDIVQKTKAMNPGKRVSVIFCGDFNSVPQCGIYQLMTTKHVTENMIDWTSNAEEAVKGVHLSQPFDIASACGTPQYTNFTAGFADCLDYIFYQKNNLKVNQVVPLPSNEELQMHTALPSIVFPSDHIALIADLQWT